jgi:hypothetical protein
VDCEFLLFCTDIDDNHLMAVSGLCVTSEGMDCTERVRTYSSRAVVSVAAADSEAMASRVSVCKGEDYENPICCY